MAIMSGMLAGSRLHLAESRGSSAILSTIIIVVEPAFVVAKKSFTDEFEGQSQHQNLR